MDGSRIRRAHVSWLPVAVGPPSLPRAFCQSRRSIWQDSKSCRVHSRSYCRLESSPARRGPACSRANRITLTLRHLYLDPVAASVPGGGRMRACPFTRSRPMICSACNGQGGGEAIEGFYSEAPMSHRWTCDRCNGTGEIPDESVCTCCGG